MSVGRTGSAVGVGGGGGGGIKIGTVGVLVTGINSYGVAVGDGVMVGVGEAITVGNAVAEADSVSALVGDNGGVVTSTGIAAVGAPVELSIVLTYATPPNA
jgi:hypothetical protein